MEEKIRDRQRSHIGYGSSYRKGQAGELERGTEIGAVLGGQVWKVKPDKDARSEHPCIWMQSGVVSFKNCNNYYDCTTCKYDSGMKKKVQKNNQITLYRAKGCTRCNNTGYTGRVGIFEGIKVSDKISQMIMEHKSAGAIEKQGVEEGMITMVQDGFMKALEGITTLEEVLRVQQK